MTTKLSVTTGPTEPPVLEQTIGGLLKAAATEVPGRTAIIFGHEDPALRREWTYQEMYIDAQLIALALATRFQPGERVAIWSQNTPQWVLVEFGAAIAGLILVTVNSAYRPDELAYVLKQSRSAGILVTPEYRGNKMLDSVNQVKDDCPELREIIRFDQWEQFLDSADSDVQLPEVLPSDATMIQ